LIAAFNFIVLSGFAEAVRNIEQDPALPNLLYMKHSDESSLAQLLTRDAPDTKFFGVQVRLPDYRNSLFVHNHTVSMLRCNPFDTKEVRNSTDGYAAFSLFAAAPITIELPCRLDSNKSRQLSAIEPSGACLTVPQNSGDSIARVH
jgi:hypothetical protein